MKKGNELGIIIFRSCTSIVTLIIPVGLSHCKVSQPIKRMVISLALCKDINFLKITE